MAEATTAESPAPDLEDAERTAASAMSLPPMPEPPREATLAWVEDSALDRGRGPAAGTGGARPQCRRRRLAAGRHRARTAGEPRRDRRAALWSRGTRGSSPPRSTPAIAVSEEWQVETAEDIVLQSSRRRRVPGCKRLGGAALARRLREPEPLMPERPPLEKEETATAALQPRSLRAGVRARGRGGNEQPLATTDAATAEPVGADERAQEQVARRHRRPGLPRWPSRRDLPSLTWWSRNPWQSCCSARATPPKHSRSSVIWWIAPASRASRRRWRSSSAWPRHRRPRRSP